MTKLCRLSLPWKKQDDGSIKVIVGEDVYQSAGSPGVSDVIQNVKRCVLAQDSYIQARMDDNDNDPACRPHRWNEEHQCVEVQANIDGQEVWFSAKEIISQILNEAIRRAELPDEFEWRGGCPVHANLGYRSMLKDLLPNPGGQSSLSWVVEEPVLVLAAAQRNLNPDFRNFQGSYLVYDLGGGSFDCAVVQISDEGYIVYSADGNPRLGAEDIHSGKLDKKAVLRRSLMSMRDAYTNAKVVWARGEDEYPFGETISENDDTGEVRFIWQLDYRTNVPNDVDGIIVYGGITRDDQDFVDYLRSWFGDEKVIPLGELFGGGAQPGTAGAKLGGPVISMTGRIPITRQCQYGCRYMPLSRISALARKLNTTPISTFLRLEMSLGRIAPGRYSKTGIPPAITKSR